MKLLSTMVAVFFAWLVLSEDEKRNGDIESDMVALTGTWNVVAVKAPEGEEGLDTLKKEGYTLVISESKLIIKTNDAVTEAVFSIDPSKKPKAIDILITREEKSHRPSMWAFMN